jgi:hypothetical protein
MTDHEYQTPELKAWNRRYRTRSLVKLAREITACDHTDPSGNWCCKCGATNMGGEWLVPFLAQSMRFHVAKLPSPKEKP